MDSHCVICGSYLADTGRMVCEKCEKPQKKSRSKYRPGKVILSLDELALQEFIYIHHKIYHRGWWQSLQFHFIKCKLDAGCIRRAERVVEDG